MKGGEIDFCIPYVGEGIHYLTHLLENARSLADNPGNIRFRVSFHSAEDRKRLEPIGGQLSSIVQAKSYQDRGILFWPSANHSAAINALAKECTGDLSIFCDFDMAFLQKGWDSKLLMASMGADIMGVPYLPIPISIRKHKVTELMPWIEHVGLWKYQNRPNLSFMAIKGAVLRDKLGSRLTEFDKFLANQGIPFQLVNNYVTGSATDLPAGTVWWMDTGFEIPRLILEHELKYIVFPHGPVAPLKSLKNSEEMSIFLMPEVFYWDGEPFLAHFKKGHSKAAKGDSGYTWEQFVGDCHAMP